MEEIFVDLKIKLTEIAFDEGSNLWFFKWGDEIKIQTDSFWRLFKKDELLEISSDHLKKVGYGQPVINLKNKLINILKTEHLQKIKTTINNDLVIHFTNEISLKIYISSMAFENWEMYILKKQYICLQGGINLAVIDNSH